MARRKLTEAAGHSGGVAAAARWQGCAKQLEKTSSPRRGIGGEGNRINGDTGKSERRDLAVCGDSNNMEGRGEMTKAPINLQDLRRSLYVKAKAEPAWRFWGLYIHVCKMGNTPRSLPDGEKQQRGARD